MDEGIVASNFLCGHAKLFSDNLDNAIPDGGRLARVKEACFGRKRNKPEQLPTLRTGCVSEWK